jgi:hypothetical protein
VWLGLEVSAFTLQHPHFHEEHEGATLGFG